MLREILQHIRDYINGLSSLQALEEWLLANLQQVLDSGDNDAIRIANELDAGIVELGENLIDESALRDNLLRIIELHDSIILPSPVTADSATKVTSISETVRVDSQVPGAVEDLRWEAVIA